MDMDIDFVNLYIQNLAKEIDELMRAKVVLETKNQHCSNQMDQLNKQLDHMKELVEQKDNDLNRLNMRVTQLDTLVNQKREEVEKSKHDRVILEDEIRTLKTKKTTRAKKGTKLNGPTISL